jgi:hypothetical protein
MRSAVALSHRGSTDDAFAMARRATREEGLFSEPRPERVVTIQGDSGLEYLVETVYRSD